MKKQKCSRCGKNLDFKKSIPKIYYEKMEHYHVTTIIACECGQAHEVIPVVVFETKPYTGDREEDDWGKQIHK